MLLQILGYFWVLCGIYIILKPKALLRKIQKKGVRKLRKILLIVGITLAWVLISSGIKHSGVLSIILLITGVIAIIKSMMILHGKTSEKLIDWSLKLSPNMLRLGGLIYIIIGLIFIYRE